MDKFHLWVRIEFLSCLLTHSLMLSLGIHALCLSPARDPGGPRPYYQD